MKRASWLSLTPRERRILRSFKSGLSVRRVAVLFGVPGGEVERVVRDWLFR